MNYSASSRPSLLNRNPQEIFLTDYQNPLPYADEDFEFVIGLPTSCEPSSLYNLNPDSKMENRFYISGSGTLVLAHKFMFLNFMDYCIEEYVEDEDFNTVS